MLLAGFNVWIRFSFSLSVCVSLGLEDLDCIGLDWVRLVGSGVGVGSGSDWSGLV